FVRLLVAKTPRLGVTWELPLNEATTKAEEVSRPCGQQQTMSMPIELAQLHTAYTIEPKGAPEFVPVSVFDDGTRTVIRFKTFGGNAPAVFTFKADGSRGLVNVSPYRVTN